MPKAVPVTHKDFAIIRHELTSRGFTRIPDPREIGVPQETIQMPGLLPESVVIHGEVGFQYSAGDLTVKVWTSCIAKVVDICDFDPERCKDTVVSRPPGTDMGWVLIVNRWNRAIYFARPVLRTKNFVRNFLRRAWVTAFKIDPSHRPKCGACQALMTVVQKNDGGTFWACFRKFIHEPPEPIWADWDISLPPRALRVVKAWRKEFQRYLERVRAEGHKPQRARTIRKPFILTQGV